MSSYLTTIKTGHGLKKPSINVHEVRPLEYEDLDRIANRNLPKTELQNLRMVHHKMAQMMATGMKDVEVARYCGRSPQTIYNLRKDPTFVELLAYYEEQEHEVWMDYRQKAAEVGGTAMEALHERLLNDPSKVQTAELRKIMETGLTFGGQKPAERSENVTVFTSAEELAQIRAQNKENVQVRSGEGGGDNVAPERVEKDITPEEGNSVSESGDESDQRAADDADDIDFGSVVEMGDGKQ